MNALQTSLFWDLQAINRAAVRGQSEYNRISRLHAFSIPQIVDFRASRSYLFPCEMKRHWFIVEIE
jgi:hypothetical protein